jgi:hypothetical protein|tara:strand:- start:1399 stop:1926 length:528 start_codon:yes stop_codon:yes gene_type:complete
VDWEAWGLTDYPKIIKHPMDLGAIQRKMDAGSYKGAHDFAKDMRLIWKNCRTYNQDGSEYYVLASNLSDMFEKKFQKVDCSSELGDVKAPSLEEKSKFAQRIYKLESDPLGKMVMMLDADCDVAIDKSDPDEIEINIDQIDPVTFRKLEAFVNTEIDQEKARKKQKLSNGSAVRS